MNPTHAPAYAKNPAHATAVNPNALAAARDATLARTPRVNAISKSSTAFALPAERRIQGHTAPWTSDGQACQTLERSAEEPRRYAGSDGPFLQPGSASTVPSAVKVNLLAFALTTVCVSMSGCDSADEKSDKADPKNGASEKSDTKDDSKTEDVSALPAETETLALDQGESKIPATIDVPKGCTTFNDDPTSIRVDFGKSGKAFGLKVAKGNEYNVDLDEKEKGLLENKYGSTNKTLEKTDTLYRWSMQREGEDPNHKFAMLVKIGEETWVCSDGNYGGWTEEQSKRQVDACKTLKAKG